MLTLLLIVPTVGFLVMLALRRKERLQRPVAFAFALLSFLLSLTLLGHSGSGFFDTVAVPWIPSFGVDYRVGVDGLSVFLVILSALLTSVSIFFGKIEKNRHLYLAFVLLMEATAIGAFISLDLFLFYIFWELMLIPAYFLMAGWGGPRRSIAALKFLIYSLVPSLFMLVAMLVLVYYGYLQTGTFTFNVTALYQLHLPLAVQYWLFLAFVLAFAVKVPLFPLHSWMPDAYSESEAPVTGLLSGMLAKTGLYAMLRFAFPLFPQGAQALMPWMAALAIIGLLYGAFLSLVQRDGKMVIAYSSLSHLSLVFLGILALNTVAVDGAVLQMFNHGIYAMALFLMFGLVEDALGTRDLRKMGQLARRSPIFNGFFLFAILAALGLPGLNGFSGEFLLLLGIFKANAMWAYVSVAAIILSGAYFIRLYQKALHGPETEDSAAGTPTFGPLYRVLLAPLLFVMLYLGLSPNVITYQAQPAAQHVVHLSEVNR